MNGDNWPLVTNEPIDVQDFKNILIIIEESMEYTMQKMVINGISSCWIKFMLANISTAIKLVGNLGENFTLKRILWCQTSNIWCLTWLCTCIIIFFKWCAHFKIAMVCTFQVCHGVHISSGMLISIDVWHGCSLVS